MESTLEIRQRIHDYIDDADERILRIFNAIIDAEEEDEELEPSEYPKFRIIFMSESKKNAKNI